ncbi:MAG: hypothetical protein A2900_04570 [Candidatus Chisholmbacteria bacterium RIFCSPLOWO2_01_FULL_50_28]|uniref:Pseudouridine synthase n=1 Tax=Candidatus Chisholmbacteria bacterium RIFCSPHIGHO2_01_FULL_52_32 TaxID=1797591 RepID=A0A1G1VSC4_9BACT|nr:MAG: hypothetical protein A2786_02175 [Candidatus Chisholmbacteria bacterium RIFCSPHIGHO2_01_FULL_52_32]OGY20325.1 MAG: hypothetical protein A2900_04570 [Candidatus Chisholmbacteria bacterium RIFCSPLOWO2_01_FULL_50_28]
MISPTVVYEDEVLCVINKPAGMVVNRSSTAPEETVQDWVEARPFFSSQKTGYTPPNTYFSDRSGIVHRLDKETSGVLVVAKTPEAFSGLLAQFRERKVTKTYLALVHGMLEPKVGDVRLPLARNPRDRKRFAVSAFGKLSHTAWKVVRVYHECVKPGVRTKGYQGFSLVEVEPQTGRTHQIRVHFSHLGHPVVSDQRYAGRRAREDSLWCPRQFLHAFRISFFHPVRGVRLEFEAELPADLKTALTLLR